MKRFVIRNYGNSIQFPYKGANVTIHKESVIETDDEGLASAAERANYEDGINLGVSDRGVNVHENSPQETDKQFNHDDRKPTASLAEKADALADVNEEDKNKLPDVPEVDDPVEEISYDDMTVVELKELAKDREVDVKGMNKAEIVKALSDFDKAGRPRIEKPRDN